MSPHQPTDRRISRTACRRRGPRGRDRITRRRAQITPRPRSTGPRNTTSATPKSMATPAAQPPSGKRAAGPAPLQRLSVMCPHCQSPHGQRKVSAPSPPAPGRTGRKPVGRAAWRQSPHSDRLTPPCVAGRARVRHCRGRRRRRGHHPPGRGRSCEHPPARASDDGGAGEPALTGPAEPDLMPADLHQRHRRRRAADTAGGLIWHGHHLAEPPAYKP
jgi:hypothetical protein